MVTVLNLFTLLTSCLLAIVLVSNHKESRRRRQINSSQTIDTGSFLKLDCRTCGQVNKILASDIGRKPICGRCKMRLMPKSMLTITRSVAISKVLQLELE